MAGYHRMGGATVKQTLSRSNSSSSIASTSSSSSNIVESKWRFLKTGRGLCDKLRLDMTQFIIDDIKIFFLQANEVDLKIANRNGEEFIR